MSSTSRKPGSPVYRFGGENKPPDPAEFDEQMIISSKSPGGNLRSEKSKRQGSSPESLNDPEPL